MASPSWAMWGPMDSSQCYGRVDANPGCTMRTPREPYHTPSGRERQRKQSSAHSWQNVPLGSHKLPASFLMPAGWQTTFNKKRKLCSFSRQLAIQTAQALYKQCWLILPQLICIQCLQSVSLLGWTHHHGINELFSLLPGILDTRLRGSGSFEMAHPFHGPGRLHLLSYNNNAKNVLHCFTLRQESDGDEPLWSVDENAKKQVQAFAQHCSGRKWQIRIWT